MECNYCNSPAGHERWVGVYAGRAIVRVVVMMGLATAAWSNGGACLSVRQCRFRAKSAFIIITTHRQDASLLTMCGPGVKVI